MKRGFTIVELLIVIVVIAIIATISIIAFNGIQQRARTTGLQSDAVSAGKQIELMRAETGSYPTSLVASDIKLSPGNTFRYRTANQGYCISIDNAQTGSYFTSSTGAQSVGPCPIAYYKLDGSAVDSSVFKNNGAPIATTSTSDRAGKANSALAFNGTTSRIDISNVGAQIGRPNLTTAAWVRPNSFTDTAAIINKNSPYLLWINASQAINTGLLASGTWHFYSAGTVIASQWQHIAMTYNGSVRRVYLNGEQVGTYTTLSGNIDSAPNGFSIGYDSCCSRYFFNGSIDEVRLYDVALTPIEMKQLYEAGD